MSVPTIVRAAVADPKAASMDALESAVESYSTSFTGSDLALVAEELNRRGDSQWLGAADTSLGFEAYL